MKKKSGPQSAFINLQVLTVLLVFLVGIFLALFAPANPQGLGFPAFSNAAAERQGPLKTALNYDSTRHLDEHGYRPNGLALAPPGSGKKNESARVAGGSAWSSLGPPGGDVTDAAVSTVDPNIVLAGIAPDG